MTGHGETKGGNATSNPSVTAVTALSRGDLEEYIPDNIFARITSAPPETQNQDAQSDPTRSMSLEELDQFMAAVTPAKALDQLI
ncbi:unnamed protein product [Parascedosporium putredinis]|uniref:Uncharacterized protein n=1 Tax=Parascedosporium putredinis TaxID=1442378 RepID=A0A9P1MCA9_9PEZI|nr:unnamed protein product [Parascedosporium putredinis]CAI7996197.1 unnamed protein product [Parascedosporium putredinis]